MERKPQYKVCRRLGEAIYSKCQSPKFSANQFPGKGRVQKHRSNVTEYGTQLTEKQKIRLSYGLTEGGLKSIMMKIKGEKGSPATLLMQTLERRLDNVVFRSGLAANRVHARQMVSHGHIIVNGRRTTIPSRLVGIDDEISVRTQDRTKDSMKKLPVFGKFTTAKWLAREGDGWSVVMKAYPSKDDADTTLAWGAVTEFYSRS
jgi:small subunit ribosomal protein S4